MIKLLKRIVTNNELFLFGLVSILYYFTAKKQEVFADSDEAWHISSGFLIRKLGFIPDFDPWSFTSDQPWYNLSWIWDIFSSYVYQFLGDDFLILNSMLYSVLIVCIYRFLKGLNGLKEDTINIVTALNALLIFEVSLFRPQLIAYFLTLYCLRLFVKSNHNYNFKFNLQFILLVILWVNIHGSVLVAFSMCGAYFLESMIKKDYARAKALFLTGLIGSLGVFVNPVGYHYLIGMMRTLDSVITHRIIEWQPFTFGVMRGYTIAIAVFLLITNLSNKKLTFAEKLITYAWLFASLITIRTLPFFLILSLPYWARCVDSLIKPSKIRVFTKERYLPTFIICFLLLLNYQQVKPYLYPPSDHVMIPKQEIDFLVKHYPGVRVLNEYTAGGFIIFYGEGKLKHFIDPRAGTVFSEDVLWEYLSFTDGKPGWEEILTKYDIEAVLLTKDQYTKRKDIDHVFRDWKNVYVGSYGYVLVSPKTLKKQH